MNTAGNHDIAILIESYLDGECSPAELRLLEDALAKDPQLRAELQGAQQVRAALTRDKQSLQLPAGDKLSFMSKVSAFSGGVGTGATASVGAAGMIGASVTSHLNTSGAGTGGASPALNPATGTSAEQAAGHVEAQTQQIPATSAGAAPSGISGPLLSLKQLFVGNLGAWLASAAVVISLVIAGVVLIPKSDDTITSNAAKDTESHKSVLPSTTTESSAFDLDSAPRGADSTEDAEGDYNLQTDAASLENQNNTTKNTTVKNSKLSAVEPLGGPVREELTRQADLPSMQNSKTTSQGSAVEYSSTQNAVSNNRNGAATSESALNNSATQSLNTQSSDAALAAANTDLALGNAAVPILVEIGSAAFFEDDLFNNLPVPDAESRRPQDILAVGFEKPAAGRWTAHLSSGLLLGTTESMPAANAADYNLGLQYALNAELGLAIEGGSESISIVELNGQFFTEINRITYVVAGLDYAPLFAQYEKFRPFVSLHAGMSDYGMLLKTRLGLARPILGPVGLHAALEFGGLSGSWQDVGKLSVLTGLRISF